MLRFLYDEAMPTIKLICCDIDGTLLLPDHSISPRSKAAIRSAYDQGIIIALVSGRIGNSLSSIQKQLKITGPLGTLNGSFVLNEHGEPILEHPLKSDEIHHILQWVQQTTLNAFVYTNNNWYASEQGYWTENELKISGFEGKTLPFDEIEGRLGSDEQPFKVLCMDKDPAYLSEMEAQLKSQIGAHFTILRSGPTYLEIFHHGVDKGDAVHAFSDYYQIDRSQIMAIGDYYNDVGMFKEAGYSVAMGNAPADIKAIVHHVTKANTEEGLALAIEAIL